MIILTDCDVGQTTISVNPSYNGSHTEAAGFTDILLASSFFHCYQSLSNVFSEMDYSIIITSSITILETFAIDAFV